LTAQIPGGETFEQSEQIAGLEEEPGSVTVRCS
jgi:hypothetical protein